MRDKRAGLVLNAVRQFCNSRADLADCLVALIAAEAGCEHTVTFDRDAARHAGATARMIPPTADPRIGTPA